MVPQKHNQSDNDLPPGLAKPALRALEAAGITRLEQLTQVTEADLRAMHGMGPKGIRTIRDALQAQGRSLAGEQ